MRFVDIKKVVRQRARQQACKSLSTTRFVSLAAAAAAMVIAGCSQWRPATVPLRTLSVSAGCPTRPDTLLVLLPGSWSLPEDFEREGFVAVARERRLAVDLLLVDAHVGYYRDRSIVQRLQVDVIEPARKEGYRHIWLGGISIGGFGAIIYDQSFPGDVDAVIALAPFLGSAQIAERVAAAGGLAAWQPVQGSAPAGGADELDLRLWSGLRERTSAGPIPRAPLFLGFGLADRFAANDAVLAAALPTPQVFTAEGGHDWPVWKVLWDRLLPTLPLPIDSRCGRQQ